MTTSTPADVSAGTALLSGRVVLDGGLATQLEAAGHDLSSDLWSARLLASDPDAVRAAHAAYFAAGAQVATTASYQASLDGFAAAGIERDEAIELIQRSVRIARQARDEAGLSGPDGENPALVAASVGPYGAVLAQGQEYTGDYPAPFDTVAALRAFHRPRLEILAQAGPDLFAVETIPSLVEVEAVLAEVADLGVPAWISLTTVTSPEGRVLTRRGEDAAAAFAMAAAVPQVVAIGVNCTAPEGVAAAIEAASGLGKPVVVYPNSGETWDAAARRWRGQPGLDPAQIKQWLDAGATWIGGCCRVGPGDIAEVRNALSS